jgi:O-acetylhomoserine/O-acetylserine sulfhydrylase-like pyridoxal-dependent enzyme
VDALVGGLRPWLASVNMASGLPTRRWYGPKGADAVVSFELCGGVNPGGAFVDGVELFAQLVTKADR